MPILEMWHNFILTTFLFYSFAMSMTPLFFSKRKTEELTLAVYWKMPMIQIMAGSFFKSSGFE